MTLNTSVIITNFNNSKYLGRCLRSCLKQSLDKNRYEVIVVDDGSTDASKAVLESFKGIKVVYLKENQGVAVASNVGVREAMGAYIIRVDSDDYISENSLLFLTEILLNNKDIGFVYSDHLRVDENENVLERVNLYDPEKIYRHGAGIMFRKSHLEALGLYDPALKNAEDFDLLLRYFKNFDGYRLKLPLYKYRIHEDQMTADINGRKVAENYVKKNT